MEEQMKTVLITGAAGMIGQVLMRRLADDYALRGIDVRPAAGIASASVADYEALLPYLEGVDAVAFLAALSNDPLSAAAAWRKANFCAEYPWKTATRP